jgi:DNA-binding MarR family transcriptional regulator
MAPRFIAPLAHPTRLRILAHLLQSPAGKASFVGLQRDLRIANGGTLSAHLKRLVVEDFVRITKTLVNNVAPLTTVELLPAGKAALREHCAAVAEVSSSANRAVEATL